ncbi:MAG: hypothetical protein NZ534_09425, partial [Bacteroidia bacterium]|nr:hypothetical protein [Bacteroidia bacterium]
MPAINGKNLADLIDKDLPKMTAVLNKVKAYTSAQFLQDFESNIWRFYRKACAAPEIFTSVGDWVPATPGSDTFSVSAPRELIFTGV